MKTKYYFLTIIVIVSACKKDHEAGSSANANTLQASLSMYLNDTLWQGKSPFLIPITSLNNPMPTNQGVIAYDKDSNSVGVAFSITQTGKMKTGKQGLDGNTFYQYHGIKSIYQIDTGSAFISSLDTASGMVSGTFQFSAINSAKKKILITKGSFTNVKP